MSSANRRQPAQSDDEWPDRWFVTNGVVAVGPVSFEQLLRGVAEQRIPNESVVRHESWRVWRRLEDIGALSQDGRRRTVQDLAALSSSLELRAKSPLSEPPPPPSERELRASFPQFAVESALRPVAVDATGVLGHTHDLTSALLMALSTAAAAAGADVGLVHRTRRDLGGVVCVGGHGPNTEQLLGERLTADDPTLRAARAGHSIIGEPELGENSRHVLGRLGRCLPGVLGVAMVPLLLYGDLVGLIELGRAGRPFRARDVACAEDVIESLAGRCVVMGWI